MHTCDLCKKEIDLLHETAFKWVWDGQPVEFHHVCLLTRMMVEIRENKKEIRDLKRRLA